MGRETLELKARCQLSVSVVSEEIVDKTLHTKIRPHADTPSRRHAAAATPHVPTPHVPRPNVPPAFPDRVSDRCLTKFRLDGKVRC
jgi:hypothetical protein